MQKLYHFGTVICQVKLPPRHGDQFAGAHQGVSITRLVFLVHDPSVRRTSPEKSSSANQRTFWFCSASGSIATVPDKDPPNATVVCYGFQKSACFLPLTGEAHQGVLPMPLHRVQDRLNLGR